LINETLTRRAFLRTLTVLSASALLPPVAEAQAASAAFVPVGKANAFPLHVVKPVTLPGGHPVFVQRIGAGQTAKAFHVLSALCTHKGCLVAWNAGAKQFQCPCHRGRFDMAGRVVGGPPPAPLPTLPVRVVKGMVLVGV